MTSGARHTIKDAIRTISHLGGPNVSEEDLEWAADIPSGRELLEWLATQAAETRELNIPDLSNDGPQVLSDHDLYQTVISPIALYQEEQVVLNRLYAGRATSTRDQAAEKRLLLTDYALPSTLRSRADTLEIEAQALELRSSRVKRRTILAQSAVKDMKQTVSTVRKKNDTLESTLKQQEERLADLSIAADSVVGRCNQQAVALLDSATQGDKSRTVLKSNIASLDRARHAIASAIGHLYETLDVSYSALPSASELEDDAASIQERPSRVDASSSGASALAEAAYVEELERLTRRLDQLSPRGSAQFEEQIRTYATSSESTKGVPMGKITPDIRNELERAGRTDRRLLLQRQESGLDTAIREMQENLLPKLQQTYDVLRARSATTAESEAIVSALIEELEDINDTVESTKRATNVEDHGDDEDPDTILELAVTDLLKNLLRSDGTDRPTVLLNRSDIDATLASLEERSTSTRQAEVEWGFNLRNRIAELYVQRAFSLSFLAYLLFLFRSGSHAALLAAAYENAPVNTSPPFAAPPLETAVKADARSKAEELTDAAVKLQKASELSSRDKRKLAAFNPEKSFG
ncbi:hypothetical protein C2E23DRAFT_874526 [Lenzites betulinus]|nr:hypothetical protein C2E23DRAFT_874526 [Lenzites betulinus]